jgi:hypothetical protein
VEKLVVDLTSNGGEPIVVVVANVTHLTVDDPKHTAIHFVSGRSYRVPGTVPEIAAKLWPLD